MTIEQYRREYWLKNKDRLTARQREYSREHWRKNKDKIALQHRAYRLANPEKIRANILAWERANPERNRTNRRVRRRDRYRGDLAFRLASLLRCRIHYALRGGSKAGKTLKLLGCSVQELILHLESKFVPGMTWENYGPVWHVDHKRPCASFDLTDFSQQRECFHYSNLQPLFAADNFSKGAKWGP